MRLYHLFFLLVLGSGAFLPLLSCTQAQNVKTRIPAQAADPQHQQLADELVRRWSETKVPDFLEEKKSDIAEVMDMGLRMDVEELKKILASDQETPKAKLSTLVNKKAFSSLQHQSKLKYLVENLRVGKLVPRASEEHYSRFGVYLELHLVSKPKPFAWGDVEFHFDYSLLDRRDYHLNPSWAYGNYDPDSASPAVNMGRASYYLREYLTKPDSQNEFIFHKPVEFKFLVKIVVPTGEKAKLIRELTEQKVPRPTQASWEQLISEQPLPPKKAEPEPVEVE